MNTKLYNTKDFFTGIDFQIKGPYHQDSLIRIVENPHNDIYDFDVFLPTKGFNLQRDLVWTLEQKQSLIISILKEIKLPPIYAIQFKEYAKNRTEEIGNQYQIIDGKQRLTTMLSFVKGEFPILTQSGEEVYIHQLDKWSRYRIESHNPEFIFYFEYPDMRLTDDQKIAWFEMINFAGTPQEQEHLDKLKNAKSCL